MGSRIMHAIIAIKIAEKLYIQDKTSFILGGVAPDAVHSAEEKELHTFTLVQRKLYEKDRFQFFFQKYKAHMDSPFLLGYYTHLIADDNWLSGFSTLAKNRIENDETIAPLYYNDFKLLNAKLLHHYDTEQQLFSLLNQEAHIMDIEEVSKENVFSFRKYLLKICCIRSKICMKTYKCLRLTKSLVILRQPLKRRILY